MFLFDIGLGLLLTVAISLIAHLEPSAFVIAVGLAGSLLPDWDMLLHLIKKRGKLDQWAHKHRDISHYPLITVPLCGTVIGWMFWVWFGIILAVTMTFHYLSDSDGIGWGVRWLFPFSRRYFCFKRVGNEPAKFHSWTPAEQDEIATKYGNPNWSKESKQWRFDVLVFAIGIAATALWFLTA